MNIPLVIVSFIIAAIIVNAVRRLIMKITGTQVMFINGMKQFFIIVIVTYIIYEMILSYIA